jgi:glycosyltransferase involved in cell wall biosynthesis
MVYDLIPYLFPEFVPTPHDRIFTETLGQAVDRADILLAISETSARDLDALLRARGGSRPPVRVVRLTQSFPAPRTRPGDLRQQVTRHIAADAALPFVLAVGSVDVRKNFPALARVWRALGDEIGPSMPRLIIAGRRSWHSEPFLGQLAGTGGFGGLVQLIEDATDLDLEYLYRRCLFTVLPSIYEGWGLPIGESLWFGKLCIASNASSMPEVGGELADYFDPRDLDAMAAAIRRPIVDPAYRDRREREIAAAPLRDWAAAASDLVEAVETPTGTPERSTGGMPQAGTSRPDRGPYRLRENTPSEVGPAADE